MTSRPQRAPLDAAVMAADRAALDAARAAQQDFAARYLRDLPPALAPAFRFDPHA